MHQAKPYPSAYYTVMIITIVNKTKQTMSIFQRAFAPPIRMVFLSLRSGTVAVHWRMQKAAWEGNQNKNSKLFDESLPAD